jgi:N-acetyl-anhydromuramyl-L-alanine amidase AmpD
MKKRVLSKARSTALTIDNTKLALPESQYFTQKPVKDLIILHFTAGQSARSAFDTWTVSSARVATAFIVDVDGTIYEAFPAAMWAYHLGVTGGTAHEKRSIGIEMANVGPLRVSTTDPKRLTWWPNNWAKQWCAIDDTPRYVKSSYRGIEYFASFPEPQIRATSALVSSLCDQFSIPRTIPPSSKRMEHDPNYFAKFKGIAAHHNFRADKWDVGPAFDWAALGI